MALIRPIPTSGSVELTQLTFSNVSTGQAVTYTAIADGYVVVLTNSSSVCTVKVNDVTQTLNYESVSIFSTTLQAALLPVSANDVVNITQSGGSGVLMILS